MPAARYWRIVGLESYSGGDLEFSEIALFNGSTQIQDQAIITSTFAPVSGTVAALNDNSLATTVVWSALAVQMPNFEIRWDFVVDADVTRMEFGRGLLEANGLWRFTCQYSADGVVWFGYQIAMGGVEVPLGSLSDLGPFDPFQNQTHNLHKPTRFYTYNEVPSGAFRLSASIPVVHPSAADGLFQPVSTEKPFGLGPGSYYKARISDSLQLLSGVVSGDFCVEAFVKNTSLNSNTPTALFEAGDINTGTRTIDIRNINSTTTYMRVNGIDSQNIHSVVYEWNHYAMCLSGTTLRGFFNGTQTHEVTGVGAVASGGNSLRTMYYLVGYCTDIRFTRAARYTASFTPPIRPLGFNLTDPALRRLFRSGSAGTKIDRQWGGTHHITGTVKNLSSPNQPVRRRVQLIHETSGIPIRETWSDAVTGEYTFSEISPQARYSVVAYDHTGVFRAVVADNLIPTP